MISPELVSSTGTEAIRPVDDTDTIPVDAASSAKVVAESVLPPKKRARTAAATTAMDDKKRRRLALNRQSARLRRELKRDRLDELQNAADELRHRNANLRRENEEIRRYMESNNSGGVGGNREEAPPHTQHSQHSCVTPRDAAKHEQYMSLIQSALAKHNSEGRSAVPKANVDAAAAAAGPPPQEPNPLLLLRANMLQANLLAQDGLRSEMVLLAQLRQMQIHVQQQVSCRSRAG